jgi:ubiquinone/menaquinone biosynthesis C-methylase UbiE
MSATYTPGHQPYAIDFMSARSFDSHGQFFAEYLAPGLTVLDCGCGPGTITRGLAARIAPGIVTGVDFAESQIAKATADALAAGAGNATFRTADVYALPFADASFDRIFSHALFEHLGDPLRAMRELLRVLKPGGVVGVCCPDWGGFLLTPPTAVIAAALDAYTALQTRNGGDVRAGRKLGTWMVDAGFRDVRMSARYEVYASRHRIGEFLALQLEQAGDATSAATWRAWIDQEAAMCAQAWAWAIGVKG